MPVQPVLEAGVHDLAFEEHATKFVFGHPVVELRDSIPGRSFGSVFDDMLERYPGDRAGDLVGFLGERLHAHAIGVRLLADGCPRRLVSGIDPERPQQNTEQAERSHDEELQ